MTIPPSIQDYRQPSFCIDSDHPAIQTLANKLTDAYATDRENAVALYYWVRDEIRYNPYCVSAEKHQYLASTTMQAGQGWCVTKAILLAALCRATGIPARLGFADVRNHLSTERMRASMETDIFYYHGYTAVYLEGEWLKATPAFNLQLCERFGLKALEFDGRSDSIYHEFDHAGNRHMEYLNDRGQHLDLPLDEMLSLFSLVHSLVENVESASSVVILWNGRQPPTFSGHIDTSHPVVPLPGLVAS